MVALGVAVEDAQGEPSCGGTVGYTADFSRPGTGTQTEALCRDVNEAIAGEHEERIFWRQVAGAEYAAEAVPEDSVTPFEADLFAVRFRNAREGFAGGAICKEPTAPAEVDACERVPVIYGSDEETGWHESYFSRDDRPGYVGAIAWIRKGEALAVGGTGTYPRREPNPKSDTRGFDERAELDKTEGAGDARAWHYYDGTWHEISDTLPAEMGGLSALDIWIGREEDGDEWGLAGDYGHIWEWEGGRFTASHIDRQSPSGATADPEWAVVEGPVSYTQQCIQTTCNWQASAETSDPSFFEYRVREIRIAPDRNQKRAFAFTAGCCGPATTSRRIEYLDQPKRSQTGVSPDQDPPSRSERPRWFVSSTNTYGDSVYSFALKPSRFQNPNAQPQDEFGEPQPEDDTMTWQAGQTVVAPGGSEDGSQAGPDPADGALPESLDPPPTRFVASDGDTELSRVNVSEPFVGNGVPDWMVGEAPGEVEAGIGILQTTVRDNRPAYGGLRPECKMPESQLGQFGDPSDTEVSLGTTQEFPGQTASKTQVCRAQQIQSGDTPGLDPDGPLRTRESGLQVGPSYALNAIEMLDRENVGYAVGDYGAILRLGEPPAESDPPSLGARRPAQLADRSPYEDHRPPAASSSGPVPPLAAQPRDHLDDPQMVRAGSPDGNQLGSDQPIEDAHTIVMSRDGSEGWAIGPTPESKGSGIAADARMTLHHYHGGRWTRCDPVGIPGIVEPDSACASLAEIYKRESGEPNTGGKIKLQAAARVPLEYDFNPRNDDDFEVMAVGNTLEVLDVDNGFGGVLKHRIPTVIRYSEGRWRLDELERRASLHSKEGYIQWEASPVAATSIACTGPDECWLAGRVHDNLVLRRFNGERWIDCSKSPSRQASDAPLVHAAACGDLAKRIGTLAFRAASATAGMSVSAVGERLYLAANRSVTPQNVAGLQVPRLDVGLPNVGALATISATVPAILYKDHGKDEQWSAEGGGYDPGFTDPDAPPGAVASIAVAQRADGSYEGWAVGAFEGLVGGQTYNWPLMRLDPESGEWATWRVRDAAYDHIGPGFDPKAFAGTNPQRQVALPGSGTTPGRAYVASRAGGQAQNMKLLTFNPARRRWEMAERPGTSYFGPSARPTALAPDNRGGIWAAFGTGAESNLSAGRSETYYYNYTQDPPREVFEELAHPLARGEELTDLTASPQGDLWLSSDEGRVYRRDRLTGWERVALPGWDPGRVVTSRSSVDAVAVGPDGSGLAVGEHGRVAQIGPERVVLDPAAGTVCEPEAAQEPCGTSFDLHSASIAPDGSAMVGGEKLALLWRPAGGELRKIATVDAPPTATITGIAMPSPNQAWVALSSGQIFAGAGDGSGAWRWRIDNTVEVEGIERLLTEDRRGEPVALNDIALDAAGRGFAVGDRGVVLEGTGDPANPWRRVPSGVTERLSSVALGIGETPAALIGGENGLILTLTDDGFQPARAGDQLRPDNGHLAAVALVPGVEDGQVEAWGAVGSPLRRHLDQRVDLNQLLHYTNAPDEPLLSGDGPGEPLPDVPAPREGEISFAAFGRSDCLHVATTNLVPCPPLENGTEPEQLVLRRIRDELLARSGEPGGPDFSIFTGDAYEVAGPNAVEAIDRNSRIGTDLFFFGRGAATGVGTDWTGAEKLQRFDEQVVDWLPDRGLPVFAPVGSRDLSETRQCAFLAGTGTQPVCAENRDRARAGENIAWRQTMEDQPAPWGEGEQASSDRFAFEPVEGAGVSVDREDQGLDPDGEEGPLDEVRVPTGGAATHYAVDMVEEASGEPKARLVVVDTSLGSLSASDAIQDPFLPEGQRAWLESVVCIEGSTFDTGQCTRAPDQQAIVVTTTPTYSYGPTDPTQNLADAAVFESILLRHRANVVVSGRLGWNGRYWATAPGIHEPCPGEDYVPDSQAPAAGTRVCGQGPAGVPDAGQLANTAQASASQALSDTGAQGILPFVVASNAGGRFDELAERSGATASDGLWRGYTIVRLDPSGDPRKTIVEQRPIFDWIGLGSRRGERVLAARARLRLEGVGREPITAPAGTAGQLGSPRFDEISSAAITHRYDLLLADPEEPWRPCEESDPECAKLAAGLERAGTAPTGEGESSCEPYLCLPPRVGQIDATTGEVRAGDGKYPDTFAVGMLSVGERVATYPLVFKRSPSFVTKAASFTPPAPQVQKVPSPQPPGTTDPPPIPNVPQIQIPTPPAPPGIPPLSAAAPPELQPPSPPALPPPAQQPTPLDLTVAPPGLSISTPTALIQPPTPPVNPAPPGGARKEARQRQAAAQKGGAEGDASETQENGGDMAQGPPSSNSAASTRLEASRGARGRPEPSFTALAAEDQPSAWAQGALYGGGLTLGALILAFSWATLRPTPRRRPPEVPAPAWARQFRRRR